MDNMETTEEKGSSRTTYKLTKNDMPVIPSDVVMTLDLRPTEEIYDEEDIET